MTDEADGADQTDGADEQHNRFVFGEDVEELADGLFLVFRQKEKPRVEGVGEGILSKSPVRAIHGAPPNRVP